jgi:hypothetical protein
MREAQGQGQGQGQGQDQGQGQGKAQYSEVEIEDTQMEELFRRLRLRKLTHKRDQEKGRAFAVMILKRNQLACVDDERLRCRGCMMVVGAVTLGTLYMCVLSVQLCMLVYVSTLMYACI